MEVKYDVACSLFLALLRGCTVVDSIVVDLIRSLVRRGPVALDSLSRDRTFEDRVPLGFWIAVGSGPVTDGCFRGCRVRFPLRDFLLVG